MQRSEIQLDTYELRTSGVAGGHTYIIAEIEVAGHVKKLSVFFANTTEEAKLSQSNPIKVIGQLEYDEATDEWLVYQARIKN